VRARRLGLRAAAEGGGGGGGFGGVGVSGVAGDGRLRMGVCGTPAAPPALLCEPGRSVLSVVGLSSVAYLLYVAWISAIHLL